MPTVLLIRHGENDYVKKGRLAGRLPGVHLNDKGLAQAKNLALFFTDKPIKAVYASPLDRTMETAAPIAKSHNLKVISRDGLNEIDMGKWEDKTIKQLSRQKLWTTVQQNPSRFRFPEGESFAEAQLRIANEIESISGLYKQKDMVICVGHSDMIKLAVAYFIGLPLDKFQGLIVQPASITCLDFSKNRTVLVNLNAHPTTKQED